MKEKSKGEYSWESIGLVAFFIIYAIYYFIK